LGVGETIGAGGANPPRPDFEEHDQDNAVHKQMAEIAGTLQIFIKLLSGLFLVNPLGQPGTSAFPTDAY
jgi:hypothetical protein